jgi:hypothetical protein
MGGSGGGGSFSSSDMAKMEQAAEARLKALASKSTKVLFVCEQVDRKALDSLLAQSRVFTTARAAVIDGSESQHIDAALDGTSFLVAFTSAAKGSPFIDAAIDKAFAKKIPGVHVKGLAKPLIPSKVTAYRWRSITWAELEAIFK